MLLLLIPMIPDASILKRRMSDAPKWQQMIYHLLTLGWDAQPEQYAILKRSMRILMILIIPIALSIHTVTSWLFAMTLRAGWDSTIFGPYFVSGAFVAGVAAVIIAMYFFRYNYKLGDYITDYHFNRIGQVLVLVSAVYIYFNLNEYFVPAYKMRTAERLHLEEMFTGHWSSLFWFAQIVCLAIPTLLLIFKRFRKPNIMLWLAVLVLVGAWLKRILIVIPVQQHPYLPIQNVPDSFKEYHFTGIEIALNILPIAGVLLIITILAKLFPVISVWEVAHEKGVDESIIK